MNKKQLIQELHTSRAAFMQAIEGLSEEDMLQIGPEGIWSIKDIMAHLTAWEAELVTALSRKLSKPYSAAPNVVKIDDIDEWNMEQYHLNAGRSLEVIRADFEGVHKQLILAVEDLKDAALSDPLKFDWMEGEPLAYLVQEIATWHEREHAESITTWRNARSESPAQHQP